MSAFFKISDLGGRRGGFIIIAAGALLDQLSKLYVLNLFSNESASRFDLLPFLEIILVWNRGISYGLFQQDSALGRWALIILMTGAIGFLLVWLMREKSQFRLIAIALLLAGAIGNVIDRIVHGAVVDFLHFHVGGFSWYVFNLADSWIVAGALGLLYDSFFGDSQTNEKDRT